MNDPLLIEVPETLATDRMDLRCPAPGDGVALHDAVAESIGALRAFIASVPWVAAEPSVAASEVYCRNARANFTARRDLPFLLFERATGGLVGCVGLHRPDWHTPKFEVGYWCRSTRAGHGFVTEAVQAVVRLAEHTLGAARVELITDRENTRSCAVATRTGFTLEGVLRHERRAPDGRLRDTCVYARTGTGA